MPLASANLQLTFIYPAQGSKPGLLHCRQILYHQRHQGRPYRRRQWHPLQYSRLENPMDRGAWWAAVHGVAKSPTRLSDFTFTFHFHALEKDIATHSSVLAWRIPGTGSLVGCHLWGRTESDMTEATAAAAAYQ